MAFINEAEREINVKVVFYSAEPGAAAAVVRHIGAATRPDLKVEQSLALDGGFTVTLLQILPALGRLRGYSTRFHLYAVSSESGAVEPDDVRLLVFRGADGCLLVGGEGEAAALARLDGVLAAQGYRDVAIVYGGEGRDAAARGRGLGFPDGDALVVDATTGAGALDAFKLVAKKVLAALVSHPLPSRPTPAAGAVPLAVDPSAPPAARTLEETQAGLDEWQRAYHEKAIWVVGLEEARWTPDALPEGLPGHTVHVVRPLAHPGFVVMSNGLSAHPISRLELRADTSRYGWQMAMTISVLGRLAYRAAREGEAPWLAHHVVTTAEEPIFGLEHFVLDPAGTVHVGVEPVTILRPIPITSAERDEVRSRSLAGDAMAAWLAERRETALDRWLPALAHDRPFGPG